MTVDTSNPSWLRQEHPEEMISRETKRVAMQWHNAHMATNDCHERIDLVIVSPYDKYAV
jgi:hypothetical protein